MKLHQDTADARHRISAYDSRSVTVSNTRLDATFLVTPDALHTGLALPPIASLSWEHVTPLHDAEVGILIIGTGPTQVFPGPELYLDLAKRGIGLEVMDSAAACRTYNILLAEGREVAALIMLR
jgi:uncharacterized protein